MTAISRRNLLTQLLPGAAVAAAGVATIGWTIAPESADALPLGMAGAARVEVDELVEKAQIGPPPRPHPSPGPPPRPHPLPGPRPPRRPHHRPRRRWECWWHRGRRICDWRWR
jgi:hypothetical protein